MTSTKHSHYGQRFFDIQQEIYQGTATSETLDAYLLVGEAYFRELAAHTTNRAQEAHRWKATLFHTTRHGDMFTKAQFCIEQAQYFMRLAQANPSTQTPEPAASHGVRSFQIRAVHWLRLARVCLQPKE